MVYLQCALLRVTYPQYPHVVSVWSVRISTPGPVLTIGTGSAPGSPECVQQYSIVPPCPVQCTPRGLALLQQHTPSLHAGRGVRSSQENILWEVLHNFGAEITKYPFRKGRPMVSWRPSIGILVKDETLQTRRDETETEARSCSDGGIRSSISRAANDPSVFTIMDKSPTLLALSHLRHFAKQAPKHSR